MHVAGSRILEALQKIEADGMYVRRRTTKQGDLYSFGDSRYAVEVTIEPTKWLGLVFKLLRTRLEYSIDTDLYRLNDPDNQLFVNDIESAIVNFLQDLQENRIRITNRHKRMLVLIPRGDKYILIKQGRFTMSETSLKSADKVLAGNDFSSFVFKEG